MKKEKFLTNEKLESIYRFLFNEKQTFGGPGSGRHPEGRNQDDGINVHPNSPEIKNLMVKAKESGAEVEKIGQTIASQFGGNLSVIDYKSAGSIARKANDYYKGNVNKVKDTVRNTIILDKHKIEESIKYAKQLPGYVKTNLRNPGSDSLGYKGCAIVYRTKNGIYAEVQINTPEMIYAKETESRARKMIGNEKYDEIYKHTGIKGGMGHKLFEEWRTLKDEGNLKRKENIEKESKEYYSHFFIANFMKTNYEIIRIEISKGNTVYFEWEFEEIALKYLGDGHFEAKNKGYGGPFPVRYDAKLVAEALLSNPRIMSKEEYDTY
jgi:hypothetical protein